MAPPHTAIKTATQVWETSETTGTGTLSLAGAVSGFRTFVAGVGDAAKCRYYIRLRNGTEWEWGIGTVTDATPDTLARTTVLRSSNANAAVNFSGGTKDVWIGPGPDSTVHVATSAPAVTDDNDTQQGFLPGSFWLNTSTDVLYVLVDDTNGAAVWVPLNKHLGNVTAESELTISAGAVTITDIIHSIDTESDAAEDDLQTLTLSGVRDGSVVYLRSDTTTRIVYVTTGGNITLPHSAEIQLQTGHYTKFVYKSSTSKWIVEGINMAPEAFRSATDGATVTFAIDRGQKWTVTLAGNRTLAINADWNGAIFILELEQDATGSRTVTWFSGITWAAGSAPTLTTTANKSDAFIFIRRGSGNYFGAVLAQNYTNP